MASESCIKDFSEKPSKIREVQAHTMLKPELTTKEAPKNIENLVAKKTSPENVSEAISQNPPQQETAVTSLASKIDSSLHLADSKRFPAFNLTHDKHNKTSDSIVSAKTSASSKTSERLDFVESEKSSLCRGSTSTDMSDESSCSSLSSSVNKPHKANDLRWEAMRAVRSKDGALGLWHFRLLKKLGCGDIGSVYLSELCRTKCYFAMKVMDKASLAGRKKLLRAQTEREILQSLDHPFLPTLYTHFEAEKFSCLVMEFCPGGDLHTLRQRQPGKHFSEQAAKFYVAEVLLSLEYLHMLGIVYRDLKPENVLVRDDGHIMLSDFDLSLRCSVSPPSSPGPSIPPPSIPIFRWGELGLDTVCEPAGGTQSR